VFNELKFALAAVPETLIAALQGIISLRRIEKVRAVLRTLLVF
jgi:hypothetical protein